MKRKTRYGRVYPGKGEPSADELLELVNTLARAASEAATACIAKTLEEVRREGHTVTGLRVKYELGRLWVGFPVEVDAKEYLPAIRACQNLFRWKGKSSLASYLADEHGKGRTYKELADELNELIRAWTGGEEPGMGFVLGLDEYLKSKGYTPESELYDEERLRRIVKYFWTRK